MSEVRDPVHEVVHRSDARTGDQSIKAPQRYVRVKSGRSRPRSPSCHVTASLPYGKAIKRFPKVSEVSERNEHYQLSWDVAVRTRKNAMKLRQSIELHCKGNPFTVESPLKSVSSSALVPEKAK